MKPSFCLLLLSGIACGALAELNKLPKLLHVPFSRKTIHSSSSSFNNKRDGTYTTSLYNSMQSIYLITISIGTPAQSFQLVADTGSSDVWVSGSECPETVCPVTRFTESSSSTYKTDNSIFNITYGQGQVAGMYATDTMTIGSATISNQQFGIATTTSGIYTNTTSSSNSTLLEGVFGLAYPSLTSSETAYNPFFFNLISQKLISDPIFSIFLNSSEDLGDSGQIIFGGEDNTKHTGDVQYLPVANTPFASGSSRSSETYGYWILYSQGFGVLNGVKGDVDLQTNTAFRLLVDTGTTLTRIPNDVLSAFILGSVGSNNVAYDEASAVYQIRCSMADTDVMFQVQLTDSLAISNTPTYLNIPLKDLIVPLDSYYTSTASVCILGLLPSDTIILGENALRSFYMVFDAGQNRIGFAPAVGSNSTITGNVTSSLSSTSSSSSSSSTSNSATSSKNQSSGAVHLQPSILLSLMFLIVLFL